MSWKPIECFKYCKHEAITGKIVPEHDLTHVFRHGVYEWFAFRHFKPLLALNTKHLWMKQCGEMLSIDMIVGASVQV